MKLLRICEVAELLAVSEKTVQRLVARKELQELRITKSLPRFTPEAVQEYISKKGEKWRSRNTNQAVGLWNLSSAASAFFQDVPGAARKQKRKNTKPSAAQLSIVKST
jgi:excisionase family DNA binding protein